MQLDHATLCRMGLLAIIVAPQNTMNEMEQVIPERRTDLDWIRIAAFGLLILYHIGMLYVPWTYHVKSPHIIPALEPFMLMLNPWRLALLFFISGVASRFMLAKLYPGAFLKSRTVRLLIPLLFGMLVIVPPQSYFQVIENNGYAGSFSTFYFSHYLSFSAQFCGDGKCLILPTWNHLWFVAYLWTYTVVLAVLIAAMPGIVRCLESSLVRVLSGAGVLVLPILALAVYRLVLFPAFPQTNALIGDWYNHALGFTLFAIGYLIAWADDVWAAIVRFRWVALALAVAVYASFIVLRTMHAGGMPASDALTVYGRVAYACYQWCCIVTVLAFGKLWLTRDSSTRRYLTDAIFPYYIVHQTAIIATAYALRASAWPTWLEAVVIIAVTAATCALTYEIVRRIAWLRPLFGLRLTAGFRGHK